MLQTLPQRSSGGHDRWGIAAEAARVGAELLTTAATRRVGHADLTLGTILTGVAGIFGAQDLKGDATRTQIGREAVARPLPIAGLEVLPTSAIRRRRAIPEARPVAAGLAGRAMVVRRAAATTLAGESAVLLAHVVLDAGAAGTLTPATALGAATLQRRGRLPAAEAWSPATAAAASAVSTLRRVRSAPINLASVSKRCSSMRPPRVSLVRQIVS